jgi:hypothetical protein
MLSIEGVFDVLIAVADGMVAWRRGRSVDRMLLEALHKSVVNRTTDGTVVDDGRRARRILKVLADMGHGNEVEGNWSTKALAVVGSVPCNDIVLLIISKITEGDGSSTLLCVVHGSLHHVARSATIVGASAVAMLSDRRVAMRGEEANGTSTIHGALKLGQIVGAREELLRAGVTKLLGDLSVDVREEQARTTERSLLHDGRVAELLNQSLTTLDSRVRDLSSLGGVEAFPAPTLDLVDEGDHAMDICEVDEGVTDVAARLEIYTKIDEVVGTEAGIVEDSLERHLHKESVKHQECKTKRQTQSNLLGMLRSMTVVRTSLPSRIRSRRTRLC